MARLVVFDGVAPGTGLGATPEEFEYMRVQDHGYDYEFDDEVVELGRQGWVVVFVHRTQDKVTGKPSYEFIMKRQYTGRLHL